MIPLTELRIGNIIRHNVKDDAGGFCEPNEDVISEEDFNMFILDKNQLEAAEPVPLTEGWLLRFGFDFLLDSKVWYRLKSFSIKCEPDGWYWYGTHTVKLTYVYQLQNLYFALTGNELEIK
jgi:hypothetical protein